MRTEVVELETKSELVTDVTQLVERFIAEERGDGLVHLFAPHATAGLAIIETGSGTEKDLEATIERLLPREDIYVHRHGTKGHGGDHVLPAFVSPSLTVPVIEGAMALGTWQSVVFVDPNVDNPRRQLRLSFVPA